MKKITLTSRDLYKLNLHIFEIENPKGYIQVIHGMEEHQERYEPLCKVLNDNGYTVITSNMRGHGEGVEELGYFKDRDGYIELIEDQKTITKYIRETYKTEKVIIFAHSMGTIIARNLLQTESNNYEKVVLSGFPNPQPAAGIGVFLANVKQAFHGAKYRSKLLKGMATGTFNKAIKNPKTDLDWLSYNEENVDKYIKDPYCGHGFTVSAYRDLFILVQRMGNYKLYKDVNKNLPLLCIGGKDDPCIGGEKGKKNSINVLEKAGFNDIKVTIFENMRHEILNEDKKEDVYKEIISFLN